MDFDAKKFVEKEQMLERPAKVLKPYHKIISFAIGLGLSCIAVGIPFVSGFLLGRERKEVFFGDYTLLKYPERVYDIGDRNGDGLSDLLATTDSSLHLYINSGLGTYERSDFYNEEELVRIFLERR